MRIFLVYPGHSFSTIDVARGYQGAFKRAGHEIFHLDHHHNIAFYRYACDTWDELNEEYKAKFADIIWLAANDVLAKAVELLPLDLVVIVTGLLIHPRAFFGLKKLGLPLALILTESPYSDSTQKDIAQLVDVTFTNDRASVEYLQQWCPTFYLPHSWDPKRHRRQKVGNGYKHDVFFLGTMYDSRKELFDAVNWDGIDAMIVGTFLQELPDMMQIKGAMSNEEVIKHYCGSKIVLNPHKGMAVTVQPHSLGPRTYEVAACGIFQLVSDNRSELREVFGHVLPTFSNAADLEDKIRYFLAHDRQREFRAEEARRLVCKCTFDHRLREVFLPRVKEVLGWP